MTTQTYSVRQNVVSVLGFVGLGIYFGIVLTKSEVLSWFRIQEMFRFQAFHMFGVIGSAVGLGVVWVQLLKRFNAKDRQGNAIQVPDKPLQSRWGTQYWLGGTLFGMGWALTGACPGPLYALVGQGIATMLIPIFSAVLGVKCYAMMRKKLPH